MCRAVMIMSVWKHLVHELRPCNVSFTRWFYTDRIVCDVAYLSGQKISICQALNAGLSNVLRRIKLQTCIFVLV